MSDIFGTPRPRPEPSSGGGGTDRRRRVLVPTLVTLALLLFLGSIFMNVYTDRLWFRSVGYSEVWNTLLLTRVGLSHPQQRVDQCRFRTESPAQVGHLVGAATSAGACDGQPSPSEVLEPRAVRHRAGDPERSP